MTCGGRQCAATVSTIDRGQIATAYGTRSAGSDLFVFQMDFIEFMCADQ
jgi:hypothetical protein